MATKSFKLPARAGFTLIELSIVLVIIGLIIGGILVGRDLIKAAEVRSVISDVDKFKAAANAFRLKYGYFPGDIPPTVAAEYGFFQFTGASAGTAGYGDGNGAIDSLLFSQEGLPFWRHLSDANLIAGNYGTIGNSAIDSTNGRVSGVVAEISQSMPPAKIGASNYFLPRYGSFTGLTNVNYYLVTAVLALTTGVGTSVNSQVPPKDAYAIDSKIDDGFPAKGRVRSSGSFSCTQTVSSVVYYVLDSTATDTCYLYFIF